MAPSSPNKSSWSLFGAVGAAVGASACCTVPLILVSLGAGGAWMSGLTALEPYRPLFIVLAVGMLAFAFRRNVRQQSGPDCDCDTSINPRTKNILLGLGALATLGLIISPWLLPGAVNAGTASVAPGPTEVQEVTLAIEGMSCPSCTTTVTMALDRTDGVVEARVTYAPPQAVVKYDASKVGVDALISAISNTGYPARSASETLTN